MDNTHKCLLLFTLLFQPSEFQVVVTERSGAVLPQEAGELVCACVSVCAGVCMIA